MLRGTPDLGQRPLGPPTDDMGWADGRSDEIDFDDRSLAEVALASTGSFDALDAIEVDVAPSPRSGPAVPSRGGPPRPAPEPARRPPRGMSPAETVVKGVGHREEAVSPARYQPRVAARPIKERGRHRATGPNAPQAGGGLLQKAEWLYQEALKEVAVGNLNGARRHLKLAASFAPDEHKIQSALQNLGV